MSEPNPKAEYLGKSKAPGYCKVKLLERAFVKHPAGKTLYPPEWAVTFDETEKE